MTSNTIEWHKECLENRRKTLEHLVVQRDKLTESIDQMVKEIYFYNHQIKEAESKKKTSFDSERFLIKKSV